MKFTWPKYYAVIVALMLLVFATMASAQTVPDVKNPTGVEFTPSVDHATIDGYELDILRTDGSVLQTINIGKPPILTGDICRASVNVQPIAFGVGYSMRLRAVAGGATSDYTTSVNRFERAPGRPGGLTIKAVLEAALGIVLLLPLLL